MIASRCVVVAVAGLVAALCAAGCSVTGATPRALGAPSSVVPNVGGSPRPPDVGTGIGDPARTRCRLDDLSAERADGGYVQGMNQVRVVWTNRSGHTCSMDGFGGVDLVDAQGRHYSAPRSSASPPPVSLRAGGRAHSTISYVAAGGTEVFSPTTILATPPNETRSVRIPWGTGGVPRFERPTAYELNISPVLPNAS